MVIIRLVLTVPLKTSVYVMTDGISLLNDDKVNVVLSCAFDKNDLNDFGHSIGFF